MRETIASENKILRSISILGSTSLVNIFIGLFRNKIIASLFGPAGVGINSILNAIIEFVKSISGFGLPFSAVKFISQSQNGKEERIRLSHFLFICTGLFGGLICLIFNKEISELNFGNSDRSFDVLFLAIPVCLGLISKGYMSILQSVNKISLLSKISLKTNVLSFIIAIPLYLYYGLGSILIVLVTSSIVTFLVTIIQVHKNVSIKVNVNFNSFFYKISGLYKFGFIMVIVGLINNFTFLFLKNFIIREASIEILGYFQSTFSITNMAINTILISISADFFARVNAEKNNHLEFNYLTIKQVKVTSLLATPIIIFSIVFSEEILVVLYSKSFVEYSYLLELFLLGSIFRVIAWPYRFALMSIDKGYLFIITEVFWHGFFLIGTLCLFNAYSIKSIGIIYVIINFLYLILLIILIKNKTKFRFFKEDLSILYIIFLTISSFSSSYFIKGWLGYTIGVSILSIALWQLKINLFKDLSIKNIFNKINSK